MSLDEVTIRFAAGGMPETLRAFDTIETRIKRIEKASSQEVATGSKARVRSAQTEAKEREAIAKKLAAEVAKMEKSQTAATDSERKRRDGIIRKSSETAGRYASDLAKAEERAAKDATRVVEREEERKMRIRMRSSEMAGRLAAREAQQEIRASRSAANARGATGRKIGGIIGGSVGGLLSGAATMATGAVGIGGGFLLADVAKRQMSAQKAAVGVSNAAFIEGDAARGKRVDPAEILKLATQVGISTGQDKGEVLQGLHTYVNLASDLTGMMGKTKSGRSGLEEMSRLAKGQEASFGDVVSAAGYLRAQNPNMDADTMMSTMRNIVSAGKKGDISMAEMAKHVGEIGGSAAAFSGDQATNQGRMLALTQIAGRVADPAEAATSIRKFGSDIGLHAKELASAGIHVNENDGRLKDPAEILRDLFEKSGGNVAKLHALGLGERSIKLAEGVSGTYFAAEATKKGSGSAAVYNEVKSFENTVGSESQADEDFKRMMETDAEKFDQAIERIKASIGDKLVPYLDKFADKLPDLLPKIEKTIDAFAEFAAWFSENPINGLGTIVLGAVAKDLASAGIGAAVKGILASLMRGGGVPIPALGGASAGGILGKIGMVGAAGAAGAALAYEVVNYDTGSQTDAQKARLGDVLTATNLASKIRSGNGTPADIAEAQAQAAALEKKWAEKGKEATDPSLSVGETAAVGLAKITGQGDKADEMIALKQRAAAKEYEMLGQTIRQLNAAMAGLTATAQNTTPGAEHTTTPITERK